ncbi:MAG TPA: carboxylating nicotinate-nucleotide diphosphorylase [Candidatus Hydrogenedentes bacterium]|nr:carboxylating nicotinate-nucleotide diphosphorylase [Candidatus Hydrogenedentota bacterium]HQE81461.1 carboxylating nicotinate-nucleotide diphosphorylase [Candidatus Hydrogenedentota bacterium]HQH54896.1 carboxylating nicotinate-nucleotide diphosphorylase [Candidatus Hydrogenedentota bacterium]HQM47123.1 carboxylating nicotinate-nucleotide diphosphorylase [Candidatus Hydrogenedentota bacterium]
MLGLRRLVREALGEDVGQGDVTTKLTVPADARCRVRLTAKQDGVLSGIAVFRSVFDMLKARVQHWEAVEDGARFVSGDVLARFEGNTAAVLTGERVALNFVQRLSGIATITRQYADAVDGLDTRICDTRKTTPLMRSLEKQAVMHGGGANHRFGLFDGVLIKENHIVAAGGVGNAVHKTIRGTHHLMKVGVEVTNLTELKEALDAGADSILLDNMSLEMMAKAVKLAKKRNVVLEASGNVTLARVRAIAETGVHYISVGELTHSAPSVDLSLLIENA